MPKRFLLHFSFWAFIIAGQPLFLLPYLTARLSFDWGFMQMVNAMLFLGRDLLRFLLLDRMQSAFLTSVCTIPETEMKCKWFLCNMLFGVILKTAL